MPDLEHTFGERWHGGSVLDLPSPVRQLYDRAYHMGAMTSRPRPEPIAHDETRRGIHAVHATTASCRSACSTRSRTPESHVTLPVTETAPGHARNLRLRLWREHLNRRRTWTISCIRSQCAIPTAAQRLWATPLYRMVFDLDGRPWRDRFRGRL